MFRRLLPKRWQNNRWLIGVLEFGGLLLVLLLVIWLVTQRREAPQLILLVLLFITTVNFSLPSAQGAIGLVPVVAATSVLLLGWEAALVLAVGSLFLAELARPLWNPIWENINAPRPSWKQRLSTDVATLAAMATAGLAYDRLGGSYPPVLTSDNLLLFITFAVTFAAVYIGIVIATAVASRQPMRRFLADHLFGLSAAAFFGLPLALFGAVTFTFGGLPVFVIFCISILFVSILVWLSWQRNYVLLQRLGQFSVLNSVGASLRETLELPQVLARTYQRVAQLITADYYAITLLDEDGGWQPPLVFDRAGQGWNSVPRRPYLPDDFTRWVAENRRILDLNPQNMHFAEQHQLTVPSPQPESWLGVPMQTAEQVIGVLVVQRYPGSQPFSRWSRELLLAIAGQASAAIQNARLYSETLRLYNLTDEALAQRVKQLRALLDTMQQGVVMLTVDGRVVLVNRMAARLLGQPADDLLDNPLDLSLATQLGYASAEIDTLLQLLQSGDISQRDHHTYTIVLNDAAGMASRYFMERTESPVLSDDQQIIGWLMLFRDVTEEYELAERRTDLTRMIVHDLRNPISTFISNMNLVEGLLPPEDARAQVAVADARQSSYDMLDMVDSLMDINRMEAGKLDLDVDAFNLGKLADGVANRLQVLAQVRQIDLSTAWEAPLPAAWGDDDMLRRVLINLIDNALKFTPTGGRVRVQVVAEPALSAAVDDGVRCIITDTGPGIPAEFHDKVFDRYMRTNMGGAQVSGTGLGLTFCKLAVEAHDGRIWTEDNPAGGSQFIFVIPGVPLLD